MKEYNGFDSKEEYLRHTKKTLYKTGLKCMALSVAILLLMLILGIDEMIAVAGVMGISENIFWLIPKVIFGCFIIGSVGYLMSFTIKEDPTD